jgi:hypothetical protein
LGKIGYNIKKRAMVTANNEGIEERQLVLGEGDGHQEGNNTHKEGGDYFDGRDSERQVIRESKRRYLGGIATRSCRSCRSCRRRRSHIGAKWKNERFVSIVKLCTMFLLKNVHQFQLELGTKL